MTPAEREQKNAGIQPLTFQRGGGDTTAPLRHIPGKAEEMKRKQGGTFAGGDSAPVGRRRDDRLYREQLATLKREQYAATSVTPPQASLEKAK